jgi:hypothetical protein
LRVHDDDLAFLRASDLNLSPEQISKEKYAFTILRRPVDRFFSLYTDKIIGPGKNNFYPIAEVLETRRQLRSSPISIEDHRYNCHILIEWIAENLRTQIDMPTDPHWLPQSSHAHLIKMFNLHLLTTGDLTTQLATFLQPIVPDIAERLKMLEKNPSRPKIAATDVIDKALRRKVNDVYRADQINHRAVGIHWRELQRGQISHIPRAVDVM